MLISDRKIFKSTDTLVFYKRFGLILLSLVWLNVVWAQNASSKSDQSLRQELDKSFTKIINKHKLDKDQLGLVVFDASHGPDSLLYGVNEGKPFIPASLTKILTAAAVLRTLGSTHKFQTTLWIDGTQKNETLDGKLILKGGGDPGFVSESMWFLVNEFTRQGIRRIEGPIIVDESDFDTIRIDPSRDPERVDRAYDAPVGAMSFNWNAINIFIRPGEIDQPAKVFLDPIQNGYKIMNRSKTKARGGKEIAVSREGEVLFVSGQIGQGMTEVASFKNVDHPGEWAGRNLLFFLEQRGIQVTGGIKVGKRPESSRLVARAESKPVSSHVSDMMKFSNNFVAEMLTKAMSLAKGEAPATLDGGMKVIRQVVKEMGVSEANFEIVNPSGLSRKNKMRPEDLAKVLNSAKRHFPTSAEFIAAFPLSALDGTLKNRMRKESAGWIRAKTGLLSGVVGLAGYAGRKDGSILSFAFIFNGKASQGDQARQLFDQLAVSLID